MVFEEKTPDLLALLIAHAGGNASVVPVIPRPPTPAPSPYPSATAVAKKKRKRGKQIRKESSEEGQIPSSTQQSPSKEPRIMRVQQKNGLFEGASKSFEGEQGTKATIWNPAFMLSTRDPLF